MLDGPLNVVRGRLQGRPGLGVRKAHPFDEPFLLHAFRCRWQLGICRPYANSDTYSTSGTYSTNTR